MQLPNGAREPPFYGCAAGIEDELLANGQKAFSKAGILQAAYP
jgi:hypothetical protein